MSPKGVDAAAIEAIGAGFSAGPAARRSQRPRSSSVGLHARLRSRANWLMRSPTARRAFIERVDVSAHEGIHPHVGAIDVVPVVYLYARSARRRLRRGAHGRRPDRATHRHAGLPLRRTRRRPRARRAAHRRHQGPDRAHRQRRAPPGLRPDDELHPTAGATLVSARPPMVAFNVDLADGRVARPRQGDRGRAARVRRRTARRARDRPLARRSRTAPRSRATSTTRSTSRSPRSSRFVRARAAVENRPSWSASRRGRVRRLPRRRPDPRLRSRPSRSSKPRSAMTSPYDATLGKLTAVAQTKKKRQTKHRGTRPERSSRAAARAVRPSAPRHASRQPSVAAQQSRARERERRLGERDSSAPAFAAAVFLRRPDPLPAAAASAPSSSRS